MSGCYGSRNSSVRWAIGFIPSRFISLILEVTNRREPLRSRSCCRCCRRPIMAPAAGVLNDRLSRRKGDDLRRLCPRGDYVFHAVCAVAGDWRGCLYVLLFLETIFWALFEPGRSAVIPNITRTRAKSRWWPTRLSSVTWSVSLSLGSGLGGLLAAAFGRNAVFVINSLSFVVSARADQGDAIQGTALENTPPFHARELVDFSPIAEGVRYVRRDPDCWPPCSSRQALRFSAPTGSFCRSMASACFVSAMTLHPPACSG